MTRLAMVTTIDMGTRTTTGIGYRSIEAGKILEKAGRRFIWQVMDSNVRKCGRCYAIGWFTLQNWGVHVVITVVVYENEENECITG